MQSPQAPVRIQHHLLSDEPSFLELTRSCINTADTQHPVDPVSVLTGIYNITTAQVSQWFTTLSRPEDAEAFKNLFKNPGFDDQHLWDYLTGNPTNIAVHNKLAELIGSENIHDIITNSIREGHHNR